MLEGLLSPSAAALYEQLLAGTRPPLELAEVGESDEVKELVDRGFLWPSGSFQHLEPVAPEHAVEHLVLTTQHDLTERQRQLLNAREDGQALQRVYDERRAITGDIASVDLFDDPSDIRSASHDVWASAHEEIAQFHTPHFRDESHLTNERTVDLPPPDMIGRVRMRAVYERSILDVPGTLAVLRRAVEAGIEARVASSLPLKMIIVDRKVSLLPLDACAYQVVRIRSSVVAAAHMALFEQVWSHAVPLGAAAADAPQDALTPVDRAVLTMVAAGMKDDAAARQLGMSTRSLRRHLTALEKRFGVDNRVSLAVAAAQCGLL
jgi:DNA-binding CsgD family transcriptional regulator